MPQRERGAGALTKAGPIIAIAAGGLCCLAAIGVGAKMVWSSVASPPQVALTQEKIDGLVAVELEMARLSDELPKAGSMWEQAKAGMAMGRKLEDVERAHGFSNAIVFNQVLQSVQIVQNGIDPSTKTYRGPAYLEKAIAALEADSRVPAETKTTLIGLYRGQLDTMKGREQPLPGNIALVEKNYDKLQAALTGQPAD